MPWSVSAAGMIAVTLWFSVCPIKPTLGTTVPTRMRPPKGFLWHLPALLGMPQLPWGIPKQHMTCVQAPESLLKCQPPSEVSHCKNSPHFPSGIWLRWGLQEPWAGICIHRARGRKKHFKWKIRSWIKDKGNVITAETNWEQANAEVD